MGRIVIIIGILAIIFNTSCGKQNIKLTPLASINITNAIIGGATAKIQSRITTISNNGFIQMPLLEGENSLYIYPSTDSLKPYYVNNVTANAGEIYSLFLGGVPTQIDAILIKENIPFITDSSFGVRFINLSPNSSSVSINIAGNANGSEISTLSYKQITNFKSYPGLSKNNNYTFQVRDAAAGNLLATYTFSNPSNPIPRFANVTLVIRGLTVGSPAIGITKVNNDR